MNKEFAQILAEVREKGESSLCREAEGVRYLRKFAHRPRLILLGAGHVSQALAECASRVEFGITVVDDRPSFANRTLFPMAEEILCDDFHHAIQARLQIRERDYVCLLTRGHRYDADCLRDILQGEMPCYLGMMGSRRRSAGLLAELKEEGFPPERVDAVHAPIGISIGSVTPAEIAVSITAQLIQARHSRPQDQEALSRTEVSEELLQFAAEDPTPKALLLVLETKGSTPAKPGALMLVDEAGRTVGTIGGGCAEGEALLTARRMLKSGTSRVISVDLTHEMAAEEGMVCGGTMKVLVEDLPV